MTGLALAVTTPPFPWYMMLLVMLVAIDGRVEWLGFAMVKYLTLLSPFPGVTVNINSVSRIGYAVAFAFAAGVSLARWLRSRRRAASAPVPGITPAPAPAVPTAPVPAGSATATPAVSGFRRPGTRHPRRARYPGPRSRHPGSRRAGSWRPGSGLSRGLSPGSPGRRAGPGLAGRVVR